MKYKYKIVETLTYTGSVEADTEEDARALVERDWNCGRIGCWDDNEADIDIVQEA